MHHDLLDDRADDRKSSVKALCQAGRYPLDKSAADAVEAMKAGAVDYVAVTDDAACHAALANAMTECHRAMRPAARGENASARVACVTPREREVRTSLINGGTDKTIGHKLGIDPRTVELPRARGMNRLDVWISRELLRVALAARILPVIDENSGLR